MAKNTSKTKAKIMLRKWDSAEHLETKEDMALYLDACLEEAGDNAVFVAKASGTITRAKGMSQLARDTCMG
jgi:probable addiction module antidote protein